MTVSDSIYGALVRFGRLMTLRRLTLGPAGQQVPFDVVVHGVAKNYTGDELVGTIVQGDSEVTITNEEITQAQWPGPPRNGDRVVVDGKVRTVMSTESKYLGNEVLVHVMQVRG